MGSRSVSIPILANDNRLYDVSLTYLDDVAEVFVTDHSKMSKESIDQARVGRFASHPNVPISVLEAQGCPRLSWLV